MVGPFISYEMVNADRRLVANARVEGLTTDLHMSEWREIQRLYWIRLIMYRSRKSIPNWSDAVLYRLRPVRSNHHEAAQHHER